MALANTIYPTTVTWNGNTWNQATGGPMRAEWNHTGTPVLDRSGSNQYAPSVQVVDKRLIMRVRLRDGKLVTALGTSGNLVMTLDGKSTVTCTGATMVLVDVAFEQGRGAEGGGAVLTFEHESADGTTVPIS